MKQRALPQSRHMVVNVIVYGSFVLACGLLGGMAGHGLVIVLRWAFPNELGYRAFLETVIVATCTAGMTWEALLALARAEYVDVSKTKRTEAEAPESNKEEEGE